MKLLTQELIDQLPKIYEKEWEKYNEEFEFFGIVDSGDFKEYGYFVLSELEIGRGSLGLPIERDLYFKPCKVSEVRELKELWE